MRSNQKVTFDLVDNTWMKLEERMRKIEAQGPAHETGEAR